MKPGASSFFLAFGILIFGCSGAASLNSLQAQTPAALSPPSGEGPVSVAVSFRLLNISEINDEAETVEFSGVLTLQWRDARQAFDPAKEGVKEKIYSGEYQFNELAPAWYPQVTLANSSGLYESRAVLLRVKPDGTCTQIEAFDAIAKIDLKLRRYPFDHQRLSAVFEVIGFGADEVVLTTTPGSVNIDGTAIRVPQWKLEGGEASIRPSSAIDPGESAAPSAFVMTMLMNRKSLFMLRLVVVPLVLIVILSWSVFWMDRSSLGDRMSVSFVGILTAVAYQIVLSDTLPQISYITLMNGFLNLSFFLMCLTVLINLLVASSNQDGDWKHGDWIDERCRIWFPVAYIGLSAVMMLIAFVFF